MLPAWPFSIFKCLFTFDCCCKNFEVLPNIVFPLPQVTSDGICHMGGAHHLCFPLRNWDCSAWPLCSHTHGFCTCAQQLKWFFIIIIFFEILRKQVWMWCCCSRGRQVPSHPDLFQSRGLILFGIIWILQRKEPSQGLPRKHEKSLEICCRIIWIDKLSLDFLHKDSGGLWQ